MKHKLVWLILWPIVLALLPHFVEAQSSSPQLENLLVELWPEYDRPEVLVIYRAELSLTTPLPAQLTFRLPGYLEEMHAVAIERDGVLVDVAPEVIELLHEGDNLLLSFSASSPRIQFEYYDPVILTQQNQIRQLAFQFSAPYRIETTTFEVQEPFQAQDFSLAPEPGDTFVGRDGLNYHTIQVADLAPPDTFELSATYERDTTELSAQQLAGNVSTQSPGISVITESSTSEDFNLGYLLIGGGVLLLLATGGYWWWSKQRQEETAPRRKPTRPGYRKRRVSSTKAGSESSHEAAGRATPITAGGFCYRCGTALREDANFCHNCGAERRGG